ncbi:MAG: FKBP-type peptidyl-prolyl cis-trans isomerase [Oscillospiraceae bacterium]|nr:FKBP-type peptidyl-prolyl cis-trans isomerase [Oscillospiraceae bacterium]
MKRIVTLVVAMLLAVSMISMLAFADEAAAPDAVQEEAVEEAAVETEALAEEDPGASSAGAQAVEVPVSAEGEVQLEDYATIEIPSSQVAVEDYDIESYINNILNYASTVEQITEGTVEEGDLVNFDFSGVLEGEEEPFEGGTAQGYELTIGSGMFIEGFEEQMIGHSIGETFDITVTFPEEYTEELAGKNAVFTITLNYKSITTTPELTDEFVQEFSSANMDVQLNTVDELKEYTRDYLYKTRLHDAVFSAMQSKVNVVSYPEATYDIMKAYNMESLEYYVTMYAANGMEGYDADMIAQMNGFASAEDYCNQYAMNDMNTMMFVDAVAADKGIECTDEELDQYINDVITANGLEGTYTVDEFKELNGEGWVLIAKYNVLLSKVLEALEENVVIAQSAMTYYDYQTANVDDEVHLDVYVQATQSWWEDKITVYAADQLGAYFIYNMACSEEDAAKLVPGTKIHVDGYKAEWSGEIEIADATFEFIDDADTYIAESVDVTEFLGTEELVNYMNKFVSFTGLTVAASADADGNEAPFLYNWDGSGTQGDDLYFNVQTEDGQEFTFTVESYLCDKDTDVYKAVEGLQVGDVVDMEGFLYWYNGANPHITSVTVK